LQHIFILDWNLFYNIAELLIARLETRKSAQDERNNSLGLKQVRKVQIPS